MISVCYITDPEAEELIPYSKLSEPELMHMYEPEGGAFVAETPMIIERALEAGFEPVSMLVVSDFLDNAKELLAKYYADDDLKLLNVYTADEKIICNITGYKLTRGMLALMKRKPLPELGSFKDFRRIAVLEAVMNPTNVGAIFRSAAALGIDAVILTRGSSDPLYRRACRVGMGTCFLIPWTYSKSETGEELTDELHGLGYKTVSMALRDDTVSIDDIHMRGEEHLAIILGTEGDGLRTETVASSDYTVKIPMAHGVDSLNVAAASAVVFWELTR